MLEEKIDALIAALEQNTAAVLYGPEVASEAKTEDAKPETAKPKKGRGKGKAVAAATKGGEITVKSVKAQAKKIALASDDPKECMNQIRELVSEVSESCYEGNVNVGIEKSRFEPYVLRIHHGQSYRFRRFLCWGRHFDTLRDILYVFPLPRLRRARTKLWPAALFIQILKN